MKPKLINIKILLISVFLAVLSLNGRSQTFEWLRIHSIDYEWNPDMLLTCTTTDTDGNIYFFGMDEFSLNYGGTALGSLFLKKYDTDGNLLDEHTISGEAAVTGLFSDHSGNIYLFGQYYSNIDFWGELTLLKTDVSINHFYVKIDQSGAVFWGKNMNEFHEFFSNFMDAIADDGGNTYVGFDSWSDSFVVKMNENGEVLSTILQEDVSNISGLALDQNGNLIVAGSCAGWESVFNGTSMPAPFSYTNYLAKYNTESELLWVKFVEDVTCTFTKVVVDENSNIYWSGPLFIATNFDDLQSEGSAWVYDFFIVKLNPAGQYQWLREVPEVTTGDASTGNLNFLDILPNGKIVLTGFTRGSVEWEENLVSNGHDLNLDAIVWQIDEDGEFNWVKTAGGDWRDAAQSVSCDEDGNLYIAGVAGHSVSYDTISLETDEFAYPFLAKLNTEILTNTAENFGGDNLQIYPNPATDFILLKGGVFKWVKIYTLSGRLVKQKNRVGQKIEIGELDSGIYFLKAELRDGEVLSRSFVKN